VVVEDVQAHVTQASNREEAHQVEKLYLGEERVQELRDYRQADD
jgi:hypothetical protein